MQMQNDVTKHLVVNVHPPVSDFALQMGCRWPQLHPAVCHGCHRPLPLQHLD